MKSLVRLGLVSGAIAVALSLAGCASPDDGATRRAIDAVREPPTTATVPGTTATTRVDAGCDPDNPARSLRPPALLPAPGQMPVGSTMAAIQARGKLRVGVDQNTLLFGYRDPRTGTLSGFDIDVAREIARAVFGDPDAIEYTVVTTATRLAAAEKGDVDMVASLVTITCPRWAQVAFSSEYFRAAQGLLVPKNSGIGSVADLAGKRVCATKGSTSSANFRRLQPAAEMVEVDRRTECLVALQEGRVDAITADDTILSGFKAQDRNTELLAARLSVEPYGLAINQTHPDFVRFVNGVLQRMRDDGTLAGLEAKWLGGTVDAPASIPDATYRD